MKTDRTDAPQTDVMAFDNGLHFVNSMIRIRCLEKKCAEAVQRQADTRLHASLRW